MNARSDSQLRESVWLFEEDGYTRFYAYLLYGIGADTLDEHAYYVAKQYPQVGDQWDSWIDGPANAEVVGFFTMTVPAGTFQVYSIENRDSIGGELLETDYLALEVGWVAYEHQGPFYALTDCTIVGGTGCFPLAVGNEWSLEPQQVVNEKTQDQPSGYSFSPAYPNPFNATTTLTFALAHPTRVDLEVFSIDGRRVGVCLSPTRGYSAGSNTVTFDGSRLSSGLYLVRLTTEDFAATQKLVLLK